MQKRYSGANEDHCAVIDDLDGAILSESEIVDLLNGQELKTSNIKHQVEELRTLTETVKQVLENQFMSKDDKLLFLKTFPEDLTAFADGLNQILADFHHDGFDQQTIDPDLIADEVLGDG